MLSNLQVYGTKPAILHVINLYKQMSPD